MRRPFLGSEYGTGREEGANEFAGEAKLLQEAAAMTEVSGLTGEEARIDHAANAIRDMTKDMSDELRPPPLSIIEALSRLTAQAPLRSLAIAFMLGVLVARRR